MFKPLSYTVLIFAAITVSFTPAAAQEYKTFETRYATLHYTNEEDLYRFLWRISGKHVDVHTYPGFAKSRIDRIVEKVQALLDMYPQRFHVNIRIEHAYEKGPIASYSNESRTITAYSDRITDGVLAHELSHAIIYSYFTSPPPKKIQEILSQYVDKHLWSR